MPVKEIPLNFLLTKINEIIDRPIDTNEKLKIICGVLKENIPCYHWVGFYRADELKRELFLSAFVGESTEHKKILFGKGICGQAAERKKAFVVDDVAKETNYLACNHKVKSEIVIPIFRHNALVGELDIDSHITSAFTSKDKSFLEKVSKMVAELF